VGQSPSIRSQILEQHQSLNVLQSYVVFISTIACFNNSVLCFSEGGKKFCFKVDGWKGKVKKFFKALTGGKSDVA
jgi:hypothetical protein